MTFPPRGAGQKTHADTPPDATWMNPDHLPQVMPWQPGKILLGEWAGVPLGVGDDRHIVTVAGSRSGKKFALTANLSRYPGPKIVIAPKAELVLETAAACETFGPVYVLDPFNEVARSNGGRPLFKQSGYNFFSELAHSEFPAADAAQIADALIVEPPNAKDPHWTTSAKNLITGLIGLLIRRKGARATLSDLRRLLNADGATLLDAFIEMSVDEDDASLVNTGNLFKAYAVMNDDGSFGEWSKEMLSILSTARQQTARLDDLSCVTDHSSFKLADIGCKNLTIFLVLPALRMATHGGWLRMFIVQALAAMERNPIHRDALPALFVLEEFGSSIGRLSAIETAAGYIAGFGVKLWFILQDLNQLQSHYESSWQTFLGNAGVIQAFGNADLTTTKVLSEMLGQTRYVHETKNPVNSEMMARGDLGTRQELRDAPLLSPFEITRYLARETNRQLILIPGQPPIYMNRLGPGANNVRNLNTNRDRHAHTRRPVLQTALDKNSALY